MIHFPPPGLGEKIISLLKEGPHKTAVLIAKLQKQTPGLTAQGIYKSLRVLRKNKIVLLHKKEAMINQSWLQSLQDFAFLTEHAYQHPTSGGHFLQMKNGDKITYEFKNPVQVDIFWNHLLYVLFSAAPRSKRWYAYASHCWFLIAHREEELSLQNRMKKMGIQYLFTVTGNTKLDKAITKDFDGINSQYHMRGNSLFPNKANNLGIVLNVFGDYVIEAHYDKNVTQNIESFYKTHSTITKEGISLLKEIVTSPSQIKLAVTKDAVRAEKLSKMFEKNFYITS